MRLFLRFSCIPSLRRGMFLTALFAAMLGWGNVGAATLVVTTTADSGVGSLRAAITAANDGDVIGFDPALDGQTITLTSGELVIDKNITINGLGAGSLAVSRTTSVHFRIFHVMPGHTVTIAGLTINGGYADGTAGGILNEGDLIINDCVVSNNFSDGGDGGGILSAGTLTITRSVITSNRAGSTTVPQGDGGGIYAVGLTIVNSTISNNTADIDGGGVIGYGMVTITDSAISGNRCGLDTLQFGATGGGLYLDGTVEIRNTTISGNTASGEDSGGGGGIIIIGSSGPVTISNSTISGNFANLGGGGITNGGPLTIANSTVSGNSAGIGGSILNGGSHGTLEIGNTILKAGPGGTIANNNGGTVTSVGSNLSSDDGGGFLTAVGDQINTEPMLGPLQDNGGPTFTHDLLAGSPAVNAGDPNFTPPPFTDQRGFTRIVGGRLDIGSVESQPSGTPSPTPTATATSTATPTPTLTPTPTPSPTATPTPSASPTILGNISTRLRVETGDNVLIGGFIVTGTQPKKIIVRAIGPSLSSFFPDALADPILELHASSGALIRSNDNWRSDQEADIIATGIPPSNDLESAIVATLPANNSAYTAIVRGVNNGTGVGLVEAYDLDRTVDSKLANISTRGFVQTGDNVMIGGLIVLGQNPLRIIVRAIGPSLSITGKLADPFLELRDVNGALIRSNDNWRSDQEAEIIATGIPPTNNLESAIVENVAPGGYTAIVRGVNDTSGIALVEVYALN